MDEWEKRTPELFALLAGSAPQLRSLDHWCPSPGWNSDHYAAALPADIGRLSQLTRLVLGMDLLSVTPTWVDAMVQTLPLLQHLTLGSDNEMRTIKAGFPISIARSCTQLKYLRICGGSSLLCLRR